MEVLWVRQYENIFSLTLNMEKERNFIRPLCSMILAVASTSSSDATVDNGLTGSDGDKAFESTLLEGSKLNPINDSERLFRYIALRRFETEHGINEPNKLQIIINQNSELNI
jgi:hypothetical protein